MWYIPTVCPKRLLTPITNPSANSSGPCTAPWQKTRNKKLLFKIETSLIH